MAEVKASGRYDIGGMIRYHRKQRGLTQLALARLIGVSYQQLQKYEKGRSSITLERLDQISCALGVPIESFLREDASGGGGHAHRELFSLARSIEDKNLMPLAIKLLRVMADA